LPPQRRAIIVSGCWTPLVPAAGAPRSASRHSLAYIDVGVIVESTANGVYVSDIDIWSIVKAAPWVGSGTGVNNHRATSVDRHRNENRNQPKTNLFHRLSFGNITVNPLKLKLLSPIIW
ncbi:MAG TPA: hypothetical protein VE687_05155, partial [Stellaceae bacterium]|nr:hypothetical protein [Stellaceae bacterium]